MQGPIGMMKGSNCPFFVVKAVFSISLGFIRIWSNPVLKSISDKPLDPPNSLYTSSVFKIGACFYSSFCWKLNNLWLFSAYPLLSQKTTSIIQQFAFLDLSPLHNSSVRPLPSLCFARQSWCKGRWTGLDLCFSSIAWSTKFFCGNPSNNYDLTTDLTLSRLRIIWSSQLFTLLFIWTIFNNFEYFKAK